MENPFLLTTFCKHLIPLLIPERLVLNSLGRELFNNSSRQIFIFYFLFLVRFHDSENTRSQSSDAYSCLIERLGLRLLLCDSRWCPFLVFLDYDQLVKFFFYLVLIFHVESFAVVRAQASVAHFHAKLFLACRVKVQLVLDLLLLTLQLNNGISSTDSIRRVYQVLECSLVILLHHLRPARIHRTMCNQLVIAHFGHMVIKQVRILKRFLKVHYC